MRPTVPLAFALALLTGCNGKSGPAGAASADAATPGTGGGHDCASAKAQGASEGGPADDVLGIRPGMRPAAAKALVACANAKYVIQMNTAESGGGGDFSTPSYPHTPYPIGSLSAFIRPPQSEEMKKAIASGNSSAVMALEGQQPPNPDEIHVTFAGPPGAETVGLIKRTLNYNNQSRPLLQKVTDGLIQKYGQPSARGTWGYNGSPEFDWVYDPSGAPMSQENPAYGICVGNMTNEANVLNEACGVTIVARIGVDTSTGDPAVGSLDVWSANQSAAKAAVARATAAINAMNAPSGSAPNL